MEWARGGDLFTLVSNRLIAASEKEDQLEREMYEHGLDVDFDEKDFDISVVCAFLFHFFFLLVLYFFVLFSFSHNGCPLGPPPVVSHFTIAWVSAASFSCPSL